MNEGRVVLLVGEDLAREASQVEMRERAVIIVCRDRVMRRVPRRRRPVFHRPEDG